MERLLYTRNGWRILRLAFVLDPVIGIEKGCHGDLFWLDASARTRRSDARSATSDAPAFLLILLFNDRRFHIIIMTLTTIVSESSDCPMNRPWVLYIITGYEVSTLLEFKTQLA
jgi:hypothetical protein